MHYIYGAGNLGKVVGNCLVKSGEKFAFIDKYCRDSSLLGVPILRPQQVQATVGDALFNTVALMPLTAESQNKMLHEISALGFKKIVDFNQLETLFPSVWPDFAADGQFWRTYGDASQPIWNELACQQFRAGLRDARSVELFDQIERFRKNPCEKNYIWPDVGMQYTGIDIPAFPSHPRLNIVDLGAFIGDTLEDFLRTYGNRINTYHCFEPDPSNFKQLTALKHQLEKTNTSAARLFCHPYATGNTNEKVRFNASEDSTSSIVSTGGIAVEAVRLDDYLVDTEINYIKIDVEGAELATLQGAEHIIRSQQPDLALSLYHRPADFWEIPALIRAIQPKANFYIRQHHHWGLELTLYATLKPAD